MCKDSTPSSVDVLNRYAFELNNPVNFRDPTGHRAAWIGGLLLGLAIFAGGIIAAATLGTAAPVIGLLGATGASIFASVLGGAAITAGATAAAYSVTNRKDFEWSKYWIQTGIGFGVGALAGGGFHLLTAGIGVLGVRGVGMGVRGAISVVGGGVLSGGADVLHQTLSNLATGEKASEGLAYSALFGVTLGMLGGAVGAGFIRSIAKANNSDVQLSNFNKAREQFENTLLDSDGSPPGFDVLREALDDKALGKLRKLVVTQTIFANLAVIPQATLASWLG